MRIRSIFLMLFICFFSCKDSKTWRKEAKNFYPYSLNFDSDNTLLYFKNKDLLFEKRRDRDSSSNIHFLNFQKDSLFIKSKKIVLPSFIQDFQVSNNTSFLINTHPRTLGENNKSTDFIITYDKNFKELSRKDLDISKYPSGNSFLVGNNENIFYITEWFSIDSKTDSRKLIISEFDSLSNIVNQKVIDRKKNAFKYNPIKCMFIDDVGIVIVSDLSYYNGKSPSFRIEILDLKLKEKWSEEIQTDSIISLGYSNAERKIFVVTESVERQVHIWDYSGKKLVTENNFNNNIISVASNDHNIFILEVKPESKMIIKVDFFGKIVGKIKLPTDSKSDKRNISELIYRDNQLFLIDIDHAKNQFNVNLIDSK